MRNKKTNYFSAIFMFFVVAALLHALSPTLGRSIEQQFISLDITDGTLRKTLDQVSEISGYTIDVQSKWDDLPVTVNLKNVPFEQAILKILGNGINHAIIWNDKEKNISILINKVSQERKEQSVFGNKISREKKQHGVIDKEGKTPFSHRKQQIPLNGQGTKFEQMSPTTHY